MALHTARRHDDALSCLRSRCIYSIDSFKNILWILCLLLFSLHFHQSIINLGECLLCIIVICYPVRLLWKPVSCRHERKEIFFKIQWVKEMSIRKTILGPFSAKCLQPHRLKAKNEKKERVCICSGKEKWEQENRMWEKHFFKENNSIQFYFNIICIDTFKHRTLSEVRDENGLVLVFWYIIR